MDKHFLLSISDDRSSSHNLLFANAFFTNKEVLRLTLYYVSAAASVNSPAARDVLKQHEFEKMSREEMARASDWLEESREWAIQHGFPEEKTDTKVQPQHFGTVQDIIQEGHKGLYDAVLLGRRGLSWIEQYFSPSVSRSILDSEVDFPLWVCRMPDIKRKDVLLCADGSGECLRMADHVGYILGDDEGHNVRIFHVRELNRDPGAIIDSVTGALVENGVDESRISVKIIDAIDKAGAILQEAYNGDFAVVAVGRHRFHTGRVVKRALLGTVTLKLLDNVTGYTLWISK